MEERLHNPFFISARGWSDPIENWVNKNRIYAKDLPVADLDEAALQSLEAAQGSSIDREKALRKIRRMHPSVRDDLNQRSRVFKGLLDERTLRK